MAVTREEVLRVARLARLRLPVEEIERLTAQLNDILGHVQVLSEARPEGVEAAVEAGRAAPLRDEYAPPDRLAYPVAELAPAWAEGFFTVPRLPALDAAELDEPFEDKARAEPLERSGRADPEAGWA